MKRHFCNMDFNADQPIGSHGDLTSWDEAVNFSVSSAFSSIHASLAGVSRLERLQALAAGLVAKIADEAQLIEISVSGDDAITAVNEAALFRAAAALLTVAVRDGMRCRIRGRCWISLEADRRGDRVVVTDDGWDLSGAESGRDMAAIDRLASLHSAQVLTWRAYGLSVCEFALPVGVVK